jgi:hypothetical protein
MNYATLCPICGKVVHDLTSHIESEHPESAE